MFSNYRRVSVRPIFSKLIDSLEDIYGTAMYLILWIMTSAYKDLVSMWFKILLCPGFKNYLGNITQYITLNSIKSTKEWITYGVPQGSILGSLLFYCMSTTLRLHSGLYCVTINNDIWKIQEWIYCNKLSLNVSKTRYMVFTSQHKNDTGLDIKINEVRRERLYEKKSWPYLLILN